MAKGSEIGREKEMRNSADLVEMRPVLLSLVVSLEKEYLTNCSS